MAKIYSQLEKAQLENTTSDAANMPKGMVTYRTDTNRAKVSNGTAYKELTDEDSTQTLSNKTLASPTITGAEILQEQGSTPSTPAAGYQKWYPKTDGKVYKLTSAGLEQEIGSGSVSGGSGKNFFSDTECEDISKVFTYKQGTTAPTDGVGGSPTLVSKAIETTNPITGTKSYKLSFAGGASGQGEGWRIPTDIALDANVKAGTPIYIRAKFRTTSGYVSDQVRLFAYQTGSNVSSALVGNSNLGSYSNSLNADQTNLGWFEGVLTPSSSDTSISLLAHIAGTGTAAWDLFLDSIEFSTAAVVSTGISTLDADWVPSFNGFGIVTINHAKWHRKDEYFYFDVKFTSGTSTFVSPYFTLPTGITIDNYTSAIRNAGNWTRGATTESTAGPLLVNTGNGNFIFFGNAASVSSGGSNPLSIASGGISNNGEIVHLIGKVKIQGWSSGNTISSTQANFTAMTGKYSTNTAHSVTNATEYVINFEDKFKDDFNLVTVGAGWKCTSPVKTTFKGKAQVFLTTSPNWTLGEAAFMYIRRQGVVVGQIDAWTCQATGTHQCALAGEFSVDLEPNQYFDIAVYQNSGAAINLSGSANENYIDFYQYQSLTAVGLIGVPYERVASLITSVTGTTLADTRTDVTGGTVTVPPGRWRIGYKVATRIQRLGSLGDSYGRVNMADPNGNIMEQTISFVGNSNMATSESVYDTVSAYQDVNTPTGGTYKLQISSYHAAANGVMHVIANTYGFFSGADADSEVYAERLP